MKLQVVIADDDKMVSFFHRLMIIESGLDQAPLLFTEGKATLEHLVSAAAEDSIFLVLLDINKPAMNGWDFLDALDKELPADKVRVIMVTSSIDRADKEKAMTYSRVIDFVEKPVNAQVFRQMKRHPFLRPFFP